MSNLKQCGYLITESLNEAQLDPNYHPQIMAQSDDSVVIKTILQAAESVNRNKRMYTKDAILYGLKSPIIQEKISHKNWFGEPAHPLSDDIKRQTYIDPDKKSHIIESYEWDGNLLYGVVATTNTRAGRDLAGLIGQGCITPFSMRGLAGIIRKENNVTIVDKPLHIVTYDKVDIPSHPEAYQTAIMKNELKLSNEGLLEEVEMSQIIDYIKEESQNIKKSVDELGLDKDAIILDESHKSVSIKNEDGTYHLFTEEDINKEIDNFILSI